MNNMSITKILRVTTLVLANIRFYPEKDTTRSVLNYLNSYYALNLCSWDCNAFIVSLAEITPFDIDFLLKTYNENIRITDNINVITKYAVLISEICKKGCELYDEQKYDQLADLIDLVHGLPEAIIDREKWNEKRFWKVYVNPYRIKWDKGFLKTEQNLT